MVTPHRVVLWCSQLLIGTLKPYLFLTEIDLAIRVVLVCKKGGHEVDIMTYIPKSIRLFVS